MRKTNLKVVALAVSAGGLGLFLFTGTIGCASTAPGYGGGLVGSMGAQGGMLRKVEVQQAYQGGQGAISSGMRRTYDGTQDEVHAAALYVINRYSGNGWTVQDYGSSIVANFRQGFVSMSQTVRLTPGLAEGSTEAESTAVGNYLNTEAKMKMENDTLNYIADALTVRRSSAKRPERARDDEPAPSRAVASDVDKIGRFTDKERVDDFAVVVGIERYQNIPKADYAEHDALTMKSYFQALGVPEENVILLTGQKATRTGLAKYLEEWLPRNVTANSRVYFYYSGHGAPDPADSTAYLVPWDGDASYLKTSAYPVSRLYEKLGALKAKQVIVMLDSCFSGAGGRSVIAKGARPLVNVVHAEVPSGSPITVLAASSGDQISGSYDEQGHGLFTYFLLKGMKGGADPEDTGHLSMSALYDYVKKSVERAARRDNREQSPELHSINPALKLY